MSESTTLREAIARVIFKGAWRDPESEFAEQQWVEFKETYLDQADAVLAVLRDLPDDVIERATNAVHASLLDECGAGSSLLYCAPEADSDGFLEVQGAVDLPHLVRDLLRAAFGGEQDD